jgi:hypothetical protein
MSGLLPNKSKFRHFVLEVVFVLMVVSVQDLRLDG